MTASYIKCMIIDVQIKIVACLIDSYCIFTKHIFSGTTAPGTPPSIDSSLYVILLTCILLLESCVAFAGNTLVLVAFKRYPHIRMSTTWLICGLSVADLFGSLTTPSLVLLRLCRGTILWAYGLHLRLVILILFIIGNVAFSALIALERLLILSFPLSYMTFITTSGTAACVAVTWIYLISTSAGISYISQSILLMHPQTILGEIIVVPHNLAQTIIITHFYFLLAFTILSYLLIARIALKKLLDDRQQQTFGSEWKITKMVGTVGLVFILCYLPTVALNTMLRRGMYDLGQLLPYYMMANCIYHISAMINPYMYATKSSYFRTAFRKLLPIWFGKHTMLNNNVDAMNY